MIIKIYSVPSTSTVIIDDGISGNIEELKDFSFSINESSSTVSIRDINQAFSKTYQTSIVSNEAGVLIGDNNAVRVYLSAFQNLVTVSNGASSKYQVETIVSTDRNTELLQSILDAQIMTNKLLKKIYNPK